MNNCYLSLWALVLAASYTALFAMFNDPGYIVTAGISGGAALISYAIMAGFLWADFRDMNL
jgi:Na+/proline symporter